LASLNKLVNYMKILVTLRKQLNVI